MFVLYWFENNYDGGSFGLICGSTDRRKLENHKKSLEDQQKLISDQWLEHNKKRQEYYINSQNELADWLEENREAILERSKTESRGRKDWFHVNGTPYNSEYVDRAKNQFIKKVRDRIGGIYYYTIDEYINQEKLKTPKPIEKEFNEVTPGEFLYQGELRIEEIRVI